MRLFIYCLICVWEAFFSRLSAKRFSARHVGVFCERVFVPAYRISSIKLQSSLSVYIHIHTFADVHKTRHNGDKTMRRIMNQMGSKLKCKETTNFRKMKPTNGSEWDRKKTATTKHWATQNGSQIIHMILNEPPISSSDMLPTIRRLFRSMNESYDTYNWSDRFIEFNWLGIFRFWFLPSSITNAYTVVCIETYMFRWSNVRELFSAFTISIQLFWPKYEILPVFAFKIFEKRVFFTI